MYQNKCLIDESAINEEAESTIENQRTAELIEQMLQDLDDESERKATLTDQQGLRRKQIEDNSSLKSIYERVLKASMTANGQY